MRPQRMLRLPGLLTLLLLCGSASSQALSLPPGELVGSWSAISFEPADAAGPPRDVLEHGGAVWLTIDANETYVVTTQNPGQSTREAETGRVRVVSPATIEFQGFGAADWQSFTFSVAGDTLTLAGHMPLDLDGDGQQEPTWVEACFARRTPMTGEGDGVAGAWVRSAGRVRTYRMHVPPALAAGERAPLVLLFHGFPSSGRDAQHFMGFDSVADARGFIAVYPDGAAGSWGVGCDCTEADASGVDDVMLVGSLIGQLERERLVDVSRIYAVGYSQGAMFSHRLACDLSDRLTAVAAVAGEMPRLVSARCAPTRPISIVMLHGTADRSVPWQGGPQLLSVPDTAERWAQLNGCVGKAVEPLPDPADDGTTVTRESHSSCAAGVETILYAIHGGGHTWPGSPAAFPDEYGPMTRDISASEVIGELFARHR